MFGVIAGIFSAVAAVSLMLLGAYVSLTSDLLSVNATQGILFFNGGLIVAILLAMNVTLNSLLRGIQMLINRKD